MTQPLRVGVQSDVGRVREANEDAVGYPPNHLSPGLLAAKGQLYAVADGMGGHQAGALASATAIEALYTAYYGDPNPDVRASLYEAMAAAARAVYERAASHPAYQGMGTTLTAAVIRDDALTVANVGDSRTYLVRDGVAHQLTADHSWVADEVRAGVLTPEEARVHPRRNVLTRSLGKDPQVQVDVFEPLPLQNGDVVLLCSDGLHGTVRDEEMADMVLRYAPQSAAQGLVGLANQRGGEDNISVVVIAVGEQDATEETTFAVLPAMMQRQVDESLAAHQIPRRIPKWLYALVGMGLAGLLATWCCLLAALGVLPVLQHAPTAIPSQVLPQFTPVLSPTRIPIPGTEPVKTPTQPLPTLAPLATPSALAPTTSPTASVAAPEARQGEVICKRAPVFTSPWPSQRNTREIGWLVQGDQIELVTKVRGDPHPPGGTNDWWYEIRGMIRQTWIGKKRVEKAFVPADCIHMITGEGE